jgi:hypothetical protein
MRAPFRFSGIAAPEDSRHRVLVVSLPGPASHRAVSEIMALRKKGNEIAPTIVTVTITDGGSSHTIGIPQYAPTVVGSASGYDPAGDCNGSFMSAKFQPNNNCYAYACDIATNTYPQPGRAHGSLIPAMNGPAVQALAEKDGLVYAGKTIADVTADAAGRARLGQTGHYVALMVSPSSGSWPGDYHWARCDDRVNFASWSQKDGMDQVTNFDFAGNAIADPSAANWTVNQGPANPPQDQSDLFVSYAFHCFMFVPASGVAII